MTLLERFEWWSLIRFAVLGRSLWFWEAGCRIRFPDFGRAIARGSISCATTLPLLLGSNFLRRAPSFPAPLGLLPATTIVCVVLCCVGCSRVFAPSDQLLVSRRTLLPKITPHPA